MPLLKLVIKFKAERIPQNDYYAYLLKLAKKKALNLDKYPNFAANLEEFDFHTSRAGCEFITSHRKERVQIAVNTILHARNLIQAQMK